MKLTKETKRVLNEKETENILYLYKIFSEYQQIILHYGNIKKYMNNEIKRIENNKLAKMLDDAEKDTLYGYLWKENKNKEQLYSILGQGFVMSYKEYERFEENINSVIRNNYDKNLTSLFKKVKMLDYIDCPADKIIKYLEENYNVKNSNITIFIDEEKIKLFETIKIMCIIYTSFYVWNKGKTRVYFEEKTLKLIKKFENHLIDFYGMEYNKLKINDVFISYLIDCANNHDYSISKGDFDDIKKTFLINVKFIDNLIDSIIFGEKFTHMVEDNREVKIHAESSVVITGNVTGKQKFKGIGENKDSKKKGVFEQILSFLSRLFIGLKK